MRFRVLGEWEIQGTAAAFAALLRNGTVICWGNADYGADISMVKDQLKNVQQLCASDVSFAALLGDGSVVTWGDAECGGDSTTVNGQLKNVQQIQATGHCWRISASLQELRRGLGFRD